MAKKKASKKKTTRKPAKAQATASASALPASEGIPEGFEEIGGGYAPTWKPEEHGKLLHGRVTGGVREVEMTIGRKKQTRRCMEVTQKKSGERFTLWESAALGELFEQIAEQGEGPEIYCRFDGYGKKKPGQNPPKLFTVAIKA
jgi:hypothetical protein